MVVGFVNVVFSSLVGGASETCQNPDEEDGDKKDPEYGGAEHAAEDIQTDTTLAGCACA